MGGTGGEGVGRNRTSAGMPSSPELIMLNSRVKSVQKGQKANFLMLNISFL